MSNKNWVGILSIIFIIILIIGGSVFMYFNNEKNKKNEEVTNFLVENNLQNKVQKKEIVYDSKIGVYHAVIIFNDEPDNTYELYIDNKIILMTAYDKSNVQITDKKKAKYTVD